MSGIEVRELAIPAAWDEDTDAGRALRESAAVRNAVFTDLWDGDEGHALTPAESHAQATHQDDQRIVFLGAWLDGRMVGRSVVSWGVHEGPHVGSVMVLVLPDARRRGVGSALWRAARTRLDAEGRTTVQAWVDHRSRSRGPTIASPTGFGEIPADAPEVRFAQACGFRLEQLERISELRLDGTHELLALQATALPHADDYAIRTWHGRTPPELLDGLAALHARMSTDVPSGDLDVDEEVWDAARVVRYEDAVLAQGRRLLRAVAQHRATGEVVAFTTLGVPEDVGRPADQEDTLVHAEHRGHRLGMLVKVANLLQLLAIDPSRRRVLTWNAEENRPMLSVNEAIGFVAIGAEGAWQRTGADAGQGRDAAAART